MRFTATGRADAARRDFTMNALYCDADGAVLDPSAGSPTSKARRVRFIGDAETRIREDYLRILRFFRFFAWYGSGRPDADGLKACARLKEGLRQLSAERVWAELKRLLSAPDPARALLWMRQSGMLPGCCRKATGGASTPSIRSSRPSGPRLAAGSAAPHRGHPAARRRAHGLAGGAASPVARRGGTPQAWAQAETPAADMDGTSLRAAIYRGNRQALVDRLRLALAAARGQAGSDAGVLADVARRTRQLDFLEKWTKPVFPIGGSDLWTLGVAAGPAVGRMLRALEKDWIASDFSLDRGALLERAAKLLPEGQGKG